MFTQFAVPIAGAIIVGFIVRGVILGRRRREAERELIFLKFEIIQEVIETLRTSSEISPAYRNIALEETGDVFLLVEWHSIHIDKKTYHVVQPLWQMLAWLAVKSNPLLVQQANRVEEKILPHQNTSQLFNLLRMQEMGVPCIRWLTLGIHRSTREKFPGLTDKMTRYRELEKKLGIP